MKQKISKKRIDPARALRQLRKLEQSDLGDRFQGMTEKEIIQTIKQTRKEIWREKLATHS